MATSKLTIEPVTANGDLISVPFNPNSYRIEKTVAWRPATEATVGRALTDAKANAPATAFAGGGSRVLHLDLFFDSTELDEAFRDVRLQTDQIVRLTRIDAGGNAQRPPVCFVSWGASATADFPFTGTISSLSQQFVLFDRTGRPLRANLGVSFIEFPDPLDGAPRTAFQETTHVVRKNETLPGIATAVYGDPRKWRVIANANHIANPIDLPVGSTLTLPPR